MIDKVLFHGNSKFNPRPKVNGQNSVCVPLKLPNSIEGENPFSSVNLVELMWGFRYVDIGIQPKPYPSILFGRLILKFKNTRIILPYVFLFNSILPVTIVLFLILISVRLPTYVLI